MVEDIPHGLDARRMVGAQAFEGGVIKGHAVGWQKKPILSVWLAQDRWRGQCRRQELSYLACSVMSLASSSSGVTNLVTPSS
jgi:hypothetical protein